VSYASCRYARKRRRKNRDNTIPERLADALMHREKDVITPREYYEHVHFTDATMTDQEMSGWWAATAGWATSAIRTCRR
jgi:hypothetical protein